MIGAATNPTANITKTGTNSPPDTFSDIECNSGTRKIITTTTVLPNGGEGTAGEESESDTEAETKEAVKVADDHPHNTEAEIAEATRPERANNKI